MIFVTLGTQKYKFNRLINYIKKSDLKNVIIQKGYTICIDNENIKTVKFFKEEDMKKNIQNAEFIISHGGITIIEILKMGKKVLVVPRTKKLKESINNHQFELCEILEKQGYLLVARNEQEFKQKIKQIEKFKPKKYTSDNSIFFNNLNIIIDEILHNQ